MWKHHVYFLALLFFLVVKGHAQIVFEHAYDSASTFASGSPAVSSILTLVDFEVSGEHYVNINRHGKYISIYDMNHVLVKTISCASFPMNPPNGGSSMGTVLYLSENLFDNDPGIEFMYTKGSSATTAYTAIYNEEGTIIFSDSGVPFNEIHIPQQQRPIYNTSLGTKMVLSYFAGQAKVFGLPGVLSTAVDQGNQELMVAEGLTVSNPMPNPSVDATRIVYQLPKDVMEGEIVFFDAQSREVRRFGVGANLTSLLISTADITAGTYYYQLRVAGDASAAKRMVVIK